MDMERRKNTVVLLPVLLLQLHHSARVAMMHRVPRHGIVVCRSVARSVSPTLSVVTGIHNIACVNTSIRESSLHEPTLT